jgi:hypothetical protein
MGSLRIVIAFSIASLFTATACSSVSEDGKQWVATPVAGDDEEISSEEQEVRLGESRQAFSDAESKACSCIVPDDFRDTVLVLGSTTPPPQTTPAMCRSYCKDDVGASQFQLFCILNASPFHRRGVTQDAFLSGSVDPSALPSPNCGW